MQYLKPTAAGAAPARCLRFAVRLAFINLVQLPTPVMRLRPVRPPACKHRLLTPQALAERDMGDARGEARVVELLGVPLEAYNVVTVLGLSAYPPLMGRLTPGARREMALKVVRSVLDGGTQVWRSSGSQDSTDACFCLSFLVFLLPLLAALLHAQRVQGRQLPRAVGTAKLFKGPGTQISSPPGYQRHVTSSTFAPRQKLHFL